MIEQSMTIVGDDIECFMHPLGKFYSFVSTTVAI
jgi:hypothetical protein